MDAPSSLIFKPASRPPSAVARQPYNPFPALEPAGLLLRRRQFIQRFAVWADGAGGDQDHALGIEILGSDIADVLRGHALDRPLVILQVIHTQPIALHLQ